MPNITKKIVAIAMVLSVSALLVGPGVAQAITADELQTQIDALLTQLTALQAELATLTGEPMGITGVPAGFTFENNLKQGMSSNEVMYLQIVLNSDPATKLADSGAGSPGNETQFFGPITNAAVIKFQEKFASEVLAFWGLTSGTGFVGSTSRTKLNTLLAAGVVPPPPPPPPTEAGLTVTLDSDTPAADVIATGANGNFTKFTLAAGSEGDVSVSKISVTRTGLTSNSDLENIKVIEVDTGVHRGSIGTLNVNNKALLTFAPALVIKAGTSPSFFIRAGFITGATASRTAALGIASADDIVSNASAVNGNFPVTGNLMEVISITVAGVSVAQDGAITDSTPDVGDTDVSVLNFRVVNDNVEPVTISQITALKVGTSDASDTENLELIDVSGGGVVLGTAANWDGEGKASWSNLNIKLAKGKTGRFKIRLDVIDGPSLTVNADITDGSDVLLAVTGDTFGFFITATSANTDWASAARNGRGAAEQTINSGALNVSKSPSSVATGSVSAGSEINVATFDFDSRGEQIKITAITINFVRGTLTCAELTSFAIYDENDVIVAGPGDCASDALALTDTFITEVGVHPYTVKGKIADAVSTLDTLRIDLDDPSSSITATGMTSNNSITPTPTSDVQGNTQTIAAGSMVVRTLAEPSAKTIAVGSSDLIFATASLDAAISGEDVQIPALSVLDTTGADGDADDIDNLEIWADLTSANSSRGDIYETRVSDAQQPTGAVGADITTAITLSQTVTVAKGTFTKIAIIADLATGATTTGTPTHTFTFSAATANGASTGSSITATFTGAGQALTVGTGGVLTVTADASQPVASLLLGKHVGSHVGEQTIAVFRLAASNVEDLDLDDITINVSNGTAVDTFFFYSSSRSDGQLTSLPIQTASPAVIGTTTDATARVDFADGTVTIPANGNVKITVKAKFLAVGVNTGFSDNATFDVKVSNAGDIDTTGLASGSAVDSTGASVAANTHSLFESRPFFALSSATPSGGILNPATNTLLAIFEVKADAAEDITFENADGNTLTVNISATQNDSDGVANAFTLLDSNSTTLSTVTAADGATSVQFLFEDSDLTVGAGLTEQFRVEMNTLDFEDDGDVLQLWLDDAAAGNVDWGVDGTGSFNHADKIFRGDITAGSFANPS